MHGMGLGLTASIRLNNMMAPGCLWSYQIQQYYVVCRLGARTMPVTGKWFWFLGDKLKELTVRKCAISHTILYHLTSLLASDPSLEVRS
jgi:hypothetical protein